MWDYDEEDNYGFDEESTDNWIVKVNGAEISSWEKKIEAIEDIVDYILLLCDDELNISTASTKIASIEEKLESNEDLITYLCEVNEDTFHKIINDILKFLKIKNYTIKLVNVSGEERDFEEL